MKGLNKVLPHGKIKKIFDNVWFVEGQVTMPMPIPIKISKSMTIIRNPSSNELTLVNSMPLDEEGLKELESLGGIKNTLRIGGFHGRDDSFYKEKFGTKAYAIKGHAYSKKFDKVPIRPEEGYFMADILLEENSSLPIENAHLKIFKTSNPIEAILCLDQDGGTLVTGDSLHNTPGPNEFCNFFGKLMMKKMKFYKAYNIGPGWVEFAKPSPEDIRSILDIHFENVLPGHGEVVIGNAKEKYRPNLEENIKAVAKSLSKKLKK